MKTKIVKQLLVLIGAATLLTGCATTDGAGGMGDESQTTFGGGSSDTAFSVNPFGFGAGSGILPAN